MKTIFKLILAFVFIAQVNISQAQSGQESILIFEKNGVAGLEYVYISSETQTFVPLPSTCFQIDQSGIHVAYVSVDETTFTIKRIDNNATILQTEWQSDWEVCNFSWRNDQTLSIYTTSSQTYQRFDILDGGLRYTVTPLPDWPPNLPDRTSDDNVGVYIPSPTDRYYLYEACSGPNCKGFGDFMIYDRVLDDNVVTLSRAIISSPNYDPPGSINFGPEARWSFDDRYIAYPFVPDNIYDNFDLELYDMSLQTIHPIQEGDFTPNYRIAYEHGIDWSPADHRLVFWVIGRIPEPIAGDVNGLRHAVIYDVDQGSLTQIDQPYYLDDKMDITWKPDGTAFAFVNVNGDLVLVDALTGATQIIDTNVNRILTWREPDTLIYGLPQVISFSLVDPNTNDPIVGYDPLMDDGILNLNTLPNPPFTIRTIVSPTITGSVSIQLNGVSQIDNSIPYDFANWSPLEGSYTLQATPYTELNGTGNSGTPLTINLTVTTTTCDQTVTASDTAGLVSAINSANGDPDATTICLDGGTYTFTARDNTTGGKNALPPITTEVSIVGNGAVLDRNATDNFRFFYVPEGGNLTLENLTLMNGDITDFGGAIRVKRGTLTVLNSTLSQNSADERGGAIYGEENTSNITIVDSLISGNYAKYDGGGVYNYLGTLTIENTQIQDNLLHNSNGIDGGGVFSYGVGANLTVTESTFSGNDAHNDGAGIAVKYSTVTLTENVITGNQADDDAGAVYLVDTSATLIQHNRIQSNNANDQGDAFYIKSGTMPITFNCIALNGEGVRRQEGQVNVQNNWWGAVDGPGGIGPGSGDTLHGNNVNYTPFLTAEPVECPPLPPQTLTLVQTPSSRIEQRRNAVIPIPDRLTLTAPWADVTEYVRARANQTVFESAFPLDLREYNLAILEIQAPVNVTKVNDLQIQVETEDGDWQVVRATLVNGVYQVDLSGFAGELLWLRMSVPQTTETMPAQAMVLVKG